ncbi:MAG: DNA cytosine methyltransferase [Bacteroidota bacterium]
MKYTCVDGFSGAGGLSLGLKRAGFRIIYSFDNDPISIDTQNLNEKYFDRVAAVKNLDDLLRKNVFLKTINLNKGELFLLAGGPPCQGFSIQRIGEDTDERNDLVLKFGRLIERTEPMFFLLENVPGLRGKRGKRVLNSFISSTENFGYVLYLKVLNAEDYGVPQRRKRIFIVGIRSDLHKKEFRFPLPKTFGNARITVRDTIGKLPTPPKDGSEHPAISHHRRDRLSQLNLARLRVLKAGQGREYLPYRLLADCHKINADRIGHRNVYGRMEWNDVAPTITARFDSFTRGKFGHPVQDRSITLREGAMLQTFPIDFVFSGNKVDVARQIGNAVPPKLAEIVGRQILRYYKSIL